MIYIGIIAGIFLLDLVIKNRIEKTKEEGVYQSAVGGRILIGKYHNRGAALNLGEKVRPLVAFVSFVFSIIMLIYFLLTLTAKGNHLLKFGLSLLLGGAFSNTYDRLKRKYVVDYVSFASKSPRISSIVYNVSDFFIAIGAMLFVVSKL